MCRHSRRYLERRDDCAPKACGFLWQRQRWDCLSIRNIQRFLMSLSNFLISYSHWGLFGCYFICYLYLKVCHVCIWQRSKLLLGSHFSVWHPNACLIFILDFVLFSFVLCLSGFRAIGCGVPLSTAASVLINMGLSSKTLPEASSLFFYEWLLQLV